MLSVAELLKDLLDRKAAITIEGRVEIHGWCHGISFKAKVCVEIPSSVEGIRIEGGIPTPREGDVPMAKFSCTLRKGNRAARAAAPKKSHAPGDPLPGIVFTDNDDDTLTVTGVDKAGQDVDLSNDATLGVTSSDTSIVSVDPPAGMTVTLHGLKPGHADLTVTVTANDGSFGPFTATQPVDATVGPAGGIKVTPGTPTPRP